MTATKLALLALAVTLPSTAAAAPADERDGTPDPLVLTEKHDGKTVRAALGRTVEIRLEANPTTGYRWKLMHSTGGALKTVGEPGYRRGEADDRLVGAGGHFVATFRAAKAGRQTIRLEYRRSWVKGRNAKKTFDVTVVVAGPGADVPDRPDKPAEADVSEPGTYTAGSWSYKHTVRAKGTRSERETGELYYRGRPVPPGGKVNNYIETPWGRLYWLGSIKAPYGRMGWLPEPRRGRPRGTERPGPAPPAGETVHVTGAAKGKVLRAEVGQRVVVSLKGNPTTGYLWQVRDVTGPALKPLGDVAYRPATTPRPSGGPRATGSGGRVRVAGGKTLTGTAGGGSAESADAAEDDKDADAAGDDDAGKPDPEAERLGAGGMFVAAFEAVAPGRSRIVMVYRRPWEGDGKPPREGKADKDKPAAGNAGHDKPADAGPRETDAGPRETDAAGEADRDEEVFSVTIRVEPDPAAEAGPQGVKGRVIRMKGNFMPTVVAPGENPPRRGKREPLSVPVHVFRGAIKPFDGRADEHKAHVQTVRSDKDGRYHVALDPGEYTVVAEIDGRLYLNLMTGDGKWATVTVPEGQWVSWTIEDTSQAAF